MNTPKTQGIKYAGSKLKLLPNILSLLDGLEVKTVLDGFSGTTRVSQALAKTGFRVVSNDISEWSYIFGLCYLKNKNNPNYYLELINYLNNIKGYEGWFSANYGGVDNTGSSVQKDGKKKPWQLHNTQKLDAIRDEIDKLNLNEIDRAVALSSLMLAMDEVDNTLGHFTSYLRKWSARSYKTMQLKIPNLFVNTQENIILKNNIFDSLNYLNNKQNNINIDLAYFDPPYGSNNEKMPPSRVRYAAYYHIWASICLNDKPDLFGAAARREDTSDEKAASIFEEFRQDENGQFIAVQAIEKLIYSVDSRYVMLSYSSGGKATSNELHEILNKHGKLIKTIEINYKQNIMAEMKSTNEWLRTAQNPLENSHYEFIFLIEKF